MYLLFRFVNKCMHKILHKSIKYDKIYEMDGEFATDSCEIFKQ